MKTMGIVFSNIYDSSLGQLTNHRTVASLPFGGRYRFIDFVLSNLSNSGVYNIGVITKYNYRSLMDHLGDLSDWDLNRKNEGLVFLPPFAGGNTGVYKGKLEALYNAKFFLDNPAYENVIVCDSTVLCNIDFRPILREHEQNGADVTILANREPEDGAKRHPLIIRTDKDRVTDILTDTYVRPGSCAGMGMFIFNRRVLLTALEETFSRGLVHLERDYLQKQFNEGKLRVSLHVVDDVVLRNEDIRSYFANNMALLDKKTHDGLFKMDRPIYTKVRDEAPTYYGEGCRASGCIIADGCRVYGDIERSIIFRGVCVAKDAKVRSSIVMQGTVVEEGASLEYAILDKNVTVRAGTTLRGTADHPVIVQKGEIA